MVYFNKVEICGVDTAKLKTLSEEEKTELLRRSRDGDKQARAELIRGNLKLVLSVVQKFCNRGEAPDDLFQVGCIGLIKAIDNFNPDMGVKLSTYGVPMVMGEIRRYLRSANTLRVSRSMRETAYQAMKIKERLTAERMTEPSIEEIAKEMECPKEEVVIALESIVEPVSLFDPVYSDGRDTIFVMDQLKDTASDSDWIEELSIRQAMENLNEREKKILSMRFLGGKTQIEVSKVVGISQAQVSRIEKGALERILSLIHI